MRKQHLEFGPFKFDAARLLLSRAGTPVPLGGRAATLLAALLQRRGEVVGKAELIEAVWPGVYVEEANLSVQIGLLRKALGRTSNGRDWILTVQRVGYRFIPAAAAQVPASRVPVVVVVPFVDFGTAASAEADGFVEDLTSALAKFKSIAVVARSTAFQVRDRGFDVRQLARSMGADYVLEGSVRRLAGDVRINIQLLDGADGAHVWAETMDAAGRIADEALVGRSAAAVDAWIQGAETERARLERSESLSPYDLHLRARWLLRPSEERGNAEAHRLVHLALAMEPDNIRFLATAAEILHHRGSVGWRSISNDDTAIMLDIVDRGLTIGTDDAGALGLFASALLTARQWDLGRVTFERALATNPYNSMSLVTAGLGYGWMGETDEAETFYGRAAANGPHDPTYGFAMNGFAVVNRRRGRYEEAILFAKRALGFIPCHSGAYWNLISSLVMSGEMDEARRWLGRFRTVSPTTTISSIREGQPVVDERLLAPLLDALAVAGLPEA